ncbi:radical SAM/SPASM domain-containing protein [Shimia ponticola]|uniref:radical SAM/SPASM domain-containing protein n=1 Tax=Shimia ponticola TaxID=2582893 RepID=UPI0011BD67E2|nr:radical SAM/SPASM domain-containing protein [Shimia ponticola]
MISRVLPYVATRFQSKGVLDVASLGFRIAGFQAGAVALSNIARKSYAGSVNNPALKAIQIETLAFCNYKCSFCPTNQIEMPKGRMTDRLFESLIDQLREFEGEIRLYLRNEPLLDKRIFDFAKTADEQTKGKVVIQTNGSLLTYEAAQKLAPHAKIVVNDYTDGEVGSRIEEFAKEFDIVIANRGSDKGLSNRAGNLPSAKPKKLDAFCNRPFNQLYIAYNGQAALCCQDWTLEEIMGDASVSTLEEIWTGSTIVNKRKELLERKRTGLCAKCDYPGV